MNAETEHAGEGFRYYLRDHDLRGVASTMLGSTSPESLDERRYGFRHDRPYDEGKGRGRDRGNLRVDHGLKHNDFYTQQITRNILDKFSAV